MHDSYKSGVNAGLNAKLVLPNDSRIEHSNGYSNPESYGLNYTISHNQGSNNGTVRET